MLGFGDEFYGKYNPFSRDRLIQEELRGFLGETRLSMSLAKPLSSRASQA